MILDLFRLLKISGLIKDRKGSESYDEDNELILKCIFKDQFPPISFNIFLSWRLWI